MTLLRILTLLLALRLFNLLVENCLLNVMFNSDLAMKEHQSGNKLWGRVKILTIFYTKLKLVIHISSHEC